MKILVAATQPPVPPINGIRLPLEKLAYGFAARGHDVMLIALADAEERERAKLPVDWRLLQGPRATLSRRALWLARATVNGRPMRVDDVASALLPAIDEQLDAFAPDVFFGVGFELAGLPPLPCPSVLVVLDAVHLNVRAQAEGATGVKRILFDREAARVRTFEASAYGRFDRVVVVSPEDASALRELDPKLAVDVVPNGVDVEEYRASADVAPTPGRLLLHGTMDYEPNVRAAELLVDEVLPLVRRRAPRGSRGRGRTLAVEARAHARGAARDGHRRGRRGRVVALVRRRLRLSDGHGHGHEEQAARGNGLRTGLRRDLARAPRPRGGARERPASRGRMPPSSPRLSLLSSPTQRAGRPSAQALAATSSNTTAGRRHGRVRSRSVARACVAAAKRQLNRSPRPSFEGLALQLGEGDAPNRRAANHLDQGCLRVFARRGKNHDINAAQKPQRNSSFSSS